MKRSYRKETAAIGVAAILVTGVLGSCGKAEEPMATTASEVTETTTTAEETTESSLTYEVPDVADIVIPAYPAGYYSYHYYPEFESTNGELEGQDEYMRLRMDMGQERHFIYDDLDEIEDPDTRALAQSYADEGYIVYERTGMPRWGDIQYEFSNGFGAQYMDGQTCIIVIVERMNETLYNHYFHDHWSPDEGEIFDDGTVSGYRYFNEGSGYSICYEFNRETGFLICTEEEIRPEYWPMDPGDIDFENEVLEAYALACVDAGYILEECDNIDMYNSMADGEFTCSEGFAFWNGDALVEYVAMEEGMFYAISSPEWRYMGGDYYTEDDGTVVTVTYENEDGSPVFVFIYDRDTGLASVVDFILL